MPKKFLSLTVKPQANSGLVKRLIHAHVGGYEVPRSKKNIHASELTKQEREFCPRQYRLMDLYPDAKDASRHVSAAEAMTFNDGHDKQWRLNNDWLRKIMVGSWKCTSCGKFESFGKAPGGCNNPKVQCNWEYEEVRVEDAITGASGGLDALLLIKDGQKLRLVECKIMDKDQFKALKGPLAEHKIRTQLYLRLIARSKQHWAKQIDTTEASIVYFMRGFGIKDKDGEFSPIEEFVVKRDDAQTEVYAAKAHAVTLSRREPEYGFPCGVCKHMLSERAQGCPVMKQCFGTKHPASITWTANKQPVHTGDHVKHIADGTKVHDAQAGK